jgi:cobalt-zinc-cadmium efflux system membrane fusion protein
MAQSDVDKATAQVASTRAQATYARAARDRAERLLAIKAIPRQDYDRAIADDELAQASLSQAVTEHRRALSSANQLGAIGSTTGEMELRSPLSGVVLARDAQPGAVVSAGAPLVTVTDPSSLWLQVNAPEKLVGFFQTQGMLRFTVPAYPGTTFDARTITVGAGLDPQSRTLAVRAQILNGNQRLKPEMLASVSVETPGAVTAIVIPDAAIAVMGGRSVVFIVRPGAKGGTRFVRRRVDIGSRSGGAAVVTNGLAPGELIVTSGAFSIKAEMEKSAMPVMEM